MYTTESPFGGDGRMTMPLSDVVPELVGILQDCLAHLSAADASFRDAGWVAQTTLRTLAETLGCPEALTLPHQGDWVCPLATPASPTFVARHVRETRAALAGV
jgi:hypothetical protein